METFASDMPAERPRFAGFAFKRLPNGACRATVTLAWEDGREISGEAEGLASDSGELRCAALACVHALAQAVRSPALELLGVKAVRAFDSTVVIVSLEANRANGPRIVGSYLTDSDVPRGAALAVLHATNRLLWDYRKSGEHRDDRAG